MTTFGLLLVGATALVTTLVMSYRADHDDLKQTGAASRANASARKASVPSQLEVAACRAYAQQRTEDKTMPVSKDVASGGAGDAGGGAAGGGIPRRGADRRQGKSGRAHPSNPHTVRDPHATFALKKNNKQYSVRTV